MDTLGTNDYDDFVLELDDEFITKQPRLPEKHLSTPITDGLTQRLVEYATAANAEYLRTTARNSTARRHKSFEKWLRDNVPEMWGGIRRPFLDLATIIDQIGCVPKLTQVEKYPELFKIHDANKSGITTDLKFADEIFEVVCDTYLEMVFPVVTSDEYDRIRKKLLERVDISDETLLAASSASFWDEVVEDYRARFHERSRRSASRIDKRRFFHGRGFTVYEFQRSWWIMTYEQLQMIQDTCLGRQNVQFSLDAGMHNGSPALKSRVKQLFMWQDRCLTRYGNDGYEIVKSPEALFKTHLTTLSGGDLTKYSSFNRTVDKLKERELKRYGNWDLVRELRAIVLETTELSDAAELFGLCKLAGHPIVYADRSGRSVQAEGTPRDKTDILGVVHMLRGVKHIILSTYIKKHQEWPPFLIGPADGTMLSRHWRNRVTSLPMDSYELWNLDQIKFGKFLEFDYSEDFLQFLDDKAVCPGASETPLFWFSGDKEKERRLLLHALKEEKIDMRALVERVRRGETTREEEIIELTQKERELKTSARCFCKMVFNMRCFFTLTEYNLGEQLMKNYMPQQTMTMSDSETKTRLYNMSSSARGDRRAVIEIDFSRWNLRWRRLAVNAVGGMLNEIFGLPGVFTQAHDFFSRCTVVVTDKHFLPPGADPKKSIHDWPESSVLWRNHVGGFEGIQQKLWTVCTIGMVYSCIVDSNASFLMAGQGDNQVLVMIFADDGRSVPDRLYDVLAKLELRCERLNQIVKPDECIDSKTVLTYSKELYVGARHVQYSLKFLSRSMARMDNDIPSFGTEVAGVCANAVAVAGTLPIPLRAFHWQVFSMFRLIRTTRMRCTQDMKSELAYWTSSRRRRQFISLLPGSLGGLPVLSWGRYFMKGEVDDLSWDVAATLRLTQRVRDLSADMNLLRDGKYKPREPDFEQLLADPHSIPLTRPNDQSQLVKDAVRKELPRVVKNSWISELLTAKTEQAGSELAKQLAKTRPFYPTIMKDIYEYSLAGLRDKLYGRFTMTRTITSMVDESQFLTRIHRGNVSLLRWIKQRHGAAVSHHSAGVISAGLTFSICSQLRGQWGEGFDQSVVGTYCPLACILTNRVSTIPCVAATTKTRISEALTTTGPYPPNFGTKTRQKRSEHGVKVLTSSDTGRALKLLTVLNSQVGADSNLRCLISEILESRSPWNLAVLEQIFPSVYGGVAAHRHDSLHAKHFGILGSSTVPTHVAFSSDRSGQLVNGADDYPFVFQEHYLFLTNLLQVFCAVGGFERVFAVGTRVPIMEPLPTTSVTLADETPIDWPKYTENKLAYTDSLQVHRFSERPPQGFVPSMSDAPKRSSIVCCYLLESAKLRSEPLLRTVSTIIESRESFDVAEIANTSVYDILMGSSAYVALECVYQLYTTGLRDQAIHTDTLLHRIASEIAPSLARSLLHTSKIHDPLLRDASFSLTMGGSGAVELAMKLQGMIARDARKMLMSNFITDNISMLFCTDAAQSGMKLLRRFTVFALTRLDSGNNNFLSIRRDTGKQFRDVWKDAKSSSDYVVQFQRTCVLLRSLCRERKNKNDDQKTRALEVLDWVNKFRFTKTSTEEMKRMLRMKQTGEPERVSSKYGDMCTRSPCNGQVSFEEVTHYEGTAYAPDPKDRTESERRRELVLSHLLRPLGVTATALSVWVSLFTNRLVSGTLNGKNVLSVGVGHGAVAAACLDVGAAHVYGIDLRESIPAITHREVTMVPPEVADQGNHDRFTWTDEVFNSGGDWFDVDRYHMITHYNIACVIIDIESVLTRTLFRQALDLAPEVDVLLRVHTSEAMICEFHSMCPTIRVWNVTIDRSVEMCTFIIHIKRWAKQTAEPNYFNSQITTMRPYRPRFVRHIKTVKKRLNAELAYTLCESKTGSQREHIDLATDLLKIAINLEDTFLAERYTRTAKMLITTYDILREDESKIIPHLIKLHPDLIRFACKSASHILRSPADLIDSFLAN